MTLNEKSREWWHARAAAEPDVDMTVGGDLPDLSRVHRIELRPSTDEPGWWAHIYDVENTHEAAVSGTGRSIEKALYHAYADWRLHLMLPARPSAAGDSTSDQVRS